MRLIKTRRFLFTILILLLSSSCSRPWTASSSYIIPAVETPVIVIPAVTAVKTEPIPVTATPLPSTPTSQPNKPVVSPTPDQSHPVPTLRAKEEKYSVRYGDTLAVIARRFGVDVSSIQNANNLTNTNLLRVGQVLTIPTPSPDSMAPSFKIIPDSELVFGPLNGSFAVAGFIDSKAGYLSKYQEKVDDEVISGASVVKRVAREYSVNPRLLLALLEYQSGWITNSDPADQTRDYPMRFFDATRKGLYRQLAWAANNLNRGYYLWRVNGISSWILADGSAAPANGQVNPGTAAVQNLLGLLNGRSDWLKAVGEKGIYATFVRLFGNPFSFSFEPVIPANLKQPKMQLPFEKGPTWSYTGGPHGGWNDGSAWAAIDFAPPGDPMGCRTSSAWVVAVADGVIVRSYQGAVVQDLDGDGLEQTGWTVLYMHMASTDRVAVGKTVKAGERIGHPSCEGGISYGTHLHLARRYNGEWIPADGPLPFNLDNWITEGTGNEYDGYLKRGADVIEAWDGRGDGNQIGR